MDITLRLIAIRIAVMIGGCIMGGVVRRLEASLEIGLVERVIKLTSLGGSNLHLISPFQTWACYLNSLFLCVVVSRELPEFMKRLWGIPVIHASFLKT